MDEHDVIGAAASAAADARAEDAYKQELAVQTAQEQNVVAVGDHAVLSVADTAEASVSSSREQELNQRELLNGAKMDQIKTSDIFDEQRKQLLEHAGRYAQGHGMERLTNNTELQATIAMVLEASIKSGNPQAIPDADIAGLAQEIGMRVEDFKSQLQSISQELLHQAEKVVVAEEIQARGPVSDTFWGKVGDISKKVLKGIGITGAYSAGTITASLAITKGVALVGLGALGALPASMIVGGGFLALRIMKSRKKSQEAQAKVEQKHKELTAAFQSTPDVMRQLNSLIVSKNQEQIDQALEEIIETEIHVGTRNDPHDPRAASASEIDERRKELYQKKKETLHNKIVTYLEEGQGMESKKAEIIAHNALGLQILDSRSREIEKELDPLWARIGKKLEQVADFDVKNKSDKHLMRMGLARVGIGIGVTLFGDRDLGSRLVGAAFAGLGGRSLGEFAFRVAQRKMARPELTAQRFDEVMTSDATPEQKQQIYLEARALFADARKREALEKSDPTRYAELKIRVEKETIRQFQAMLSAVQEKNDSLGRHVESGVQIAAVRNKIEEITSGTRAAKHAEQKRATKEQATRVATQLAIGAAVSAATWYLTPAIRQFAREKITDAARFIVEHSGSAHAAGGAAIAVPSIEGGKNIHPQTPPATLREGPVSDKPITNSQLDHVHETTRFDQAVQDDDVGVGEVPVDESPAVIPLKVVATESTDVHSEPNVTTTWAGIKQEYEEGESTAQLPSTASPEQTSDLKPDFGAPPAVTETQGGTNGDHPATPTQQDVEQPSPLSKVPANIEYNGATGTYDSAHGYYTVEDKLVALSGTGEQRELEKLGGRLGWFKSDGATGSHKIAKDGYTAFLAYDGENKLYILVGEQIKGDVWTQHAVQFKDGAVLIDGNTTTPAVIEMPIEPTTLSSSVAPELPSHTPSEVISVLNDIDKNNYWSVDVEKVIAEFNLEEALKQQVEREVKFERAYIDNLISEMARYKKEYGKRQNWSAFEQEVVSNKKYIEHAQSRLSDLIDHAVAGEADKITPGGFARITGNPEKVGQDTARMTLEALAKQVKLTTRQESMTDAFADLDTNEASASSAPPSLGGSAPPEEPELSDLPSNPDSIEGQGKIERITFHEGHVQFTQGRNEGELSVSVEIKLVGFRPPDYYGKDINGIDLSKITELQHTLRVMKSYTEGYRQYSAQHGGVVDDAHKQAFIDALTFNARSYNKDGKTIINIDKFLSEMEVPIKPSAATSPPVEIGSPPVDTETSDTGTEDFVPEIKLTQQESQKLSSFMNGLDERISKLVNNKEFMGSAMAKELDVIVEKKWLPLVKNGNDYIFSTKNGAQYQVVESPWYHDQYPQGKKPETNDLIFMKKGAEDTEFFSVPYNKIVQEMQNAQAEREPLSGRVEKLIVEMARQAHQNFVEQEQTAPTLQKFDLPKDKPIGFLSIIPSESELKSDLITSGVVEQSKHMPLLLKQRGYDIKIPQGQENGLIDSGANAVATISNSVEALHATGTRDFYLDLVGHGDKTGIYFGASDSAPHVDTENLLRLVQQYPDSRFYISTVACDGGGIREQLMPLLNTPDVHDRIDVFLQAKPSEINQEGRIQDGTATPEPYSSYYNMLLMKHLNEKLPDGGYRTFGDAVYQTDKEVQKYISVNPESIVDGTLMKGITQPLRSK